jgi:hypothetical protein
MISAISGGNKLSGPGIQSDSVPSAKSKSLSSGSNSDAITKTVGDLIEKLLMSLETKTAGTPAKESSGNKDDIKSAMEQIMALIEELLAKLKGDDSSDLSQDAAPVSTKAMPDEGGAPVAAGGAVPAAGNSAPVSDDSPVSTQAMPAETAAPAPASENVASPASGAATPAPASVQAMPTAQPAVTPATADSNLTKLFDSSKGGGYTDNELKAIRQLADTMLGKPTAQSAAPATTPAAPSKSVNDLLSTYMDKAFTDGKLDDNELKGFEALTAKLNGGTGTSSAEAGGLRPVDGNISNANEAATHMFGDFLSGSMMNQVYSILDKAVKASPEDKYA